MCELLHAGAQVSSARLEKLPEYKNLDAKMQAECEIIHADYQ
jgi:hypothetical protein